MNHDILEIHAYVHVLSIKWNIFINWLVSLMIYFLPFWIFLLVAWFCISASTDISLWEHGGKIILILGIWHHCAKPQSAQNTHRYIGMFIQHGYKSIQIQCLNQFQRLCASLGNLKIKYVCKVKICYTFIHTDIRSTHVNRLSQCILATVYMIKNMKQPPLRRIYHM